MSNNREVRIPAKTVHVLMGIQRNSKQGNKNCIRQVVKDYETDLAFLEAKLKVIGGEWRIYKTVNLRDIEKARIFLLKRLIEFPEVAGYVDSEWRTALLQRECKAENKFMFDVDTKDYSSIVKFEEELGKANQAYLEKYESPKGWHYITEPFDTREVCKLEYVTLLRDGYHYVKTVGDKQ